MNGYGSHAPPQASSVQEDPHHDDDRLDDEEPRGAEEAGDPLGELAEGVGVVVDAEEPASPARDRQVFVRASRRPAP